MNALLDMVRDALMLAVTLGLPLLGVAVAAGLLAGWLGQRTGITDPAAGTALRAAAVVAALWWAGEGIAARVSELTAQTWRMMPALGRAGVPTPPSGDVP